MPADDRLRIDLRVQVKEFELEVREELPARGVTAVFGRSGSGKTTLLRSIAGFERGEGCIQLGASTWLDSARNLFVPTHQRGIGYMFQDARLFPHLDVTGNLSYAQRRSESQPQVVGFADVVDILALGDLLARYPEHLSGGEAQRVALGRTLLTQPRLLLLDEPLAALDDEHKAELLPYLDALVQEFALPMLYVSHDVEEVARLAGTMLVLTEGKVTALGASATLFERLDLQEVSGRFDASVLLDAQVVSHDAHWQLSELRVAGQSISVPMRANLQDGQIVRLRIRARDVALANQPPAGLSIRNVLAGRVQELVADPGSPYADLLIELTPTEASATGARLRSRVTRAAVDDLNLGVGSAVFALVKSVTFDA